MANIAVRKDGNAPSSPVAVWEPRWDPSRAIRDFFGWDPFREMASLTPSMPASFAPSFEIKETKDAYLFKADVPGVKEADIDITVTGNRLTVAGKREAEKQEQSDTFYTYERSYGSFTRSFTLPDGADMNGIQADMKDGVLNLSVRKLPEVQAKKIPLQSGVKKS